MLGAADERALAQRILSHWNGSALNLCGELSARESAAVLGRCGVLVCHDSGPMHLAATQGTPCIALFGNLNQPRQWFPWGDQHHVIHEPRGITLISVAAVADAVTEMVEGLGLAVPQRARRLYVVRN
jgi:ADP-heptose:LPS heptosyltransferase